jgi:hypothetical protein
MRVASSRPTAVHEHLMKSEDRNAGATTTDRVSVKLLEAA